MTYEEAIKILTELKPIPVDGFKIIAKAYDLAIDALEKQTPKKPIVRKTEDYFGYVKYILCPSCEKVEFGFNQPCFCERCGQAIDWEASE